MDEQGTFVLKAASFCVAVPPLIRLYAEITNKLRLTQLALRTPTGPYCLTVYTRPSIDIQSKRAVSASVAKTSPEPL